MRLKTMYFVRRLVIVIVFIVVTWFALSTLHKFLDPNTKKSDEELEDAQWIKTSKHFLDRQACAWMGICGLAHYRPDPAWQQRNKNRKLREKKGQNVFASTGHEGVRINEGWQTAPGKKLNPGDFDGDERVLKDVPQFVLDAAPLIHLYSKEQFWPSDLAEHLRHMTPAANHTRTNDTSYTLDNLDELNNVRGRYSYLKSRDNVEDRPDWLGSPYNKPVPYPDEPGPDEHTEAYKTPLEFIEDSKAEGKDWTDLNRPKTSKPFQPGYGAQNPLHHRSLRNKPAKPDPSGRSPAPVVLIMIDKGDGILDAFWFYFYSYNLGTTVLNIRFGNHVGDWEHSLIRFQNGIPKAVFFSAHSGGTAYSYNAVEKGKGKGREGRPVLYSALGSHAMYAMPGTHPYVLPFGLLADVTDAGPLWDPALNYIAYHFNTSLTHNADAKFFPSTHAPHTAPLTPAQLHQLRVHRTTDILTPASTNPDAPTSWFWFKGHWGDKFYELGDERQWRFVGQYHYVNGPLGPRAKNLGRSRVCQSGKTCRILESIEEGKRSSWVEQIGDIRKRGLEVFKREEPLRDLEVD